MRLTNDTIESINSQMEEILISYKDIPVSTLVERYDISVTAKNKLNLLTYKLISSKLSGDKSYLISKDIRFKTVQLTKYGQLKESMSLPVINYCDLVKEEWENSTLRNYFLETIFVFIVYQTMGKEQYLKKIVVWQPSENLLDDEFQKTWVLVKNLLLEGKIVKYIDKNNRYHTYFPAAQDSPYIHVRPHARDRRDTNPLPKRDFVTGLTEYEKHSFWINRSYILKLISKGSTK